MDGMCESAILSPMDVLFGSETSSTLNTIPEHERDDGESEGEDDVYEEEKSTPPRIVSMTEANKQDVLKSILAAKCRPLDLQGGQLKLRKDSSRYIDESLIERRSRHSSESSSIAFEDIWVKRSFEIQKYRSWDPVPSSFSDKSPEDEQTSQQAHRPRAGTWSSKSSKTTPNKERQRRISGDEILHNSSPVSPSTTKKNQHGFFDAFRPRSKSDVSRGGRKPSVISQMKSALQQSLSTPPSGAVTPTGNDSPPDSLAVPHRPRSGSDSHRSKISHMVERIRHRSHSVTSEDKRRLKGAALSPTNVFPAWRRSSEAVADPSRRRASVAVPGYHKIPGLDGVLPANLDPKHAAMLFRDSRGLPVADPFVSKVTSQDPRSEEDEMQILVKFFRYHKAYDLIPTSAKLVVFDTQLIVKKAFFALVYNGVRAAPLWDSQRQEFVGMLTITDFIRILQMYYKNSNTAMDELEGHKLETWRECLKSSIGPLISISPESSLFEAIKTLIHRRIHRLPVIDPHNGNVLYILTHKRILRFLYLYIHDLPKPSYMMKTLRELKIGTFSKIETASEETTIIEGLRKFINRRVSALPIVDKDDKLIDIYAKFDVINLAAEKSYNNLDISIREANMHRNDWFEGVHKCTLDETLETVMGRIVRAEVHRLVVVDEDEKVVGVLSLSDLLTFLVLKPAGEPPPPHSPCNEPEEIPEEDEDKPKENGQPVEEQQISDSKPLEPSPDP